MTPSIQKKTLIIFSGPPCSGKSALAQSLSSATGIQHLEMDSIRKRLMPGSVQSKADRVVAYRAMEFVASTLLTHGVPVILNATFGPLEHRREIIDISKELSVPIYLVECKVEPTTAVHRFESRHEPHPAVDLTAERVALLAQTFSYSGAGLLLDTSIDDIKSCLESVSVYLSHGDPIRSAEWLTPVCR